MDAHQLHLNIVFGTGPLGLAVVRELHSRGLNVRVISRKGRAEVPNGVEIVKGDATDASSMSPLCKQASVIYHCASPSYTRWPQEFPVLQKAILECAASSGALLVFGDNLYMYGPVEGRIHEDLPSTASGPNGRVRARMASMIIEAQQKGRVRATIGRGSDFYGPYVLRAHAGERLFKAALSGAPAQVLGNPDMPHTFTYIGDFAKGLVTLGENDLAQGQVWHIPSAETLTTRQFIELVYREAGTRPTMRAAPRGFVAVMSLFSPLMRALKEQLYQFEQPFLVDHSRFVKTFGEIATPHPVAIRKTLDWFRQRAGQAR